MAITGITMFRARDGVTDLDLLIPNRLHLKYADFRLDDGSIALVYYARTPAQPPRWAAFLNPVIASKDLSTQSSSAVVVFNRKGVYYVVTFGYGRYMIDPDLIAPSFGLRCTLNAVDPDRIRSIDRKRVDAVSRLTREQLSRDSRMGEFGLNIFQDLLSAVTGVPTAEGLGTRLYGKDAVGLNIDITRGQLGELADHLEEVYSRTTYRQKFPWVDRIGEVSGAKEVDALNRSLISGIKRGSLPDIELAPPEMIDWSRAHGFVYTSGLDPEPELTLETYFTLIRDRTTIDLETLRHDRVQLVDADGARLGGWSVHRCLSGEITYRGSTYVISDGKWYKIAADFLDEVNSAIASLGVPSVQLPPYTRADKSEGDYNRRAAAESNGELVCLDQEFISPRAWHDRIEFCDLYKADRKIIHVKRYSGSATLSHLFAQGSVSLRCLLTDPQFLAALDAKLPDSHQFRGTAPQPDTCHVIFGIVAEKGKPLQLPFFSRVALRNAAELIQNFGVTITYQEILNRS